MTAESNRTDSQQGSEAVLTLFAMMWGAAALFHNFGPSGRVFALLASPDSLNLSQALLSVAALWLIARPRELPPLAAVAVLTLVTAWFEIPQLGNHWLLTSFIDIGILISMLIARRGGSFDRQAFARTVLPMARWCLLIFYSFAAFAKLNSAFFDTAVSCSSFFFDETARSYGLGTPIAVGAGGLGRLIPIASGMTELSVPILLIGRRTRVFGALLGLIFHSVIALDRIHLFVDFSSLLAVLFLLFMPAAFAEDAVEYLEGRGKNLYLLLLAAFTFEAVLEVVGNLNLWLGFFFLQGRMLVWYLFDAMVVIGTARWLWAHRSGLEPVPGALRLPAAGKPALLALLVVVFGNGLLPYLELRTAFAYTMYSNIKMVDGQSNHFVVRSSLPLGHRQRDLVSIDATGDLGLSRYAGTPYLLPWDSFRTYAAAHPDASAMYTRAGRQVILQKLSNSPELASAPPLLVRKLFPLRAVDARNPPQCQDVFLPAL